MIDSFETPDDLAGLAADLTTRALSDAVIKRGAAVLVGTGGRSPGPVYDRLAKSSLDWSKISVTLSDDRFVPADSPESNERLVRERLLTGNAAAAKFVPMSVAADTVEAAAGAVEGAVRALAPFDVMLLGMGEDGHIASLIPGSPVLEAGMDPTGERYCLGVPAGVGSPPLARVTMTMPALLQARLTLILISGEAKRRIVAEGNGLPVHALLEQAKAPVRVLWSP